jgi:hypothetical protein
VGSGVVQQAYPDQAIGASGSGTSTLLLTNGVPNFVQTQLNLQGAGSVAVTSDSAGNVTITGSGTLLETNGVPNTLQSVLNLKGSGAISVTADGVGGVTIGGGGAAAGADTQIQYNSAGVFAASSVFAWDYTNDTLLLGSDSGTSQDTGVYLRQISNDDNNYTVLKTKLKCSNTAAGDYNNYLFWSAQYQETSAYGPQSIEGISLALNHTATDPVSIIQAFTANIYSSTSGTVNNVYGVNVNVTNGGTGTMSNAVTFLSSIGSNYDYGSPITTALGYQAEFSTHGGNIGTARGIQTHVNLGRGGITQYAGLYVEAATNELQGTISSVEVLGGVLTIVGLNPSGYAQTNDYITFYNVATATFLNGQTVQVTSTTSNTTVVANFSHANYGPTADTGNFTFSGIASEYFGLYIENQPITPATPNPYSIWVAGGKSHFGGPIEDSTNSVGTSGQLLSSTVSGTQWVNPTGLTLSTSGQGWFAAGGMTDASSLFVNGFNAAVTGFSANQVIVQQFVLQSSWTLSKVAYKLYGVAVGGNTFNFGIYSAAGAKLIDSGAFNGSISTLQTLSFTPVTLSPGVYYFAASASDSGSATGPQMQAASGLIATLLPMLNSGAGVMVH